MPCSHRCRKCLVYFSPYLSRASKSHSHTPNQEEEEDDDDDVDVTVGLSQVWDDKLYAQLTLVESAGVG